ncbi:hypothetical protein CAEBREN_11180 [Caenorhabditis brenneri]|uniref:Uncharacterized protein n=1 Tax=Caenorhabditis brenneri TaxID=135651 RepID=G0NP78_CAEBE|nr:hypothetical protein CAEBREN_11180 [Caenorhabditis brenneri]
MRPGKSADTARLRKPGYFVPKLITRFEILLLLPIFSHVPNIINIPLLEDPQTTIAQLKAELNRANLQLHQARQAIEEKDQKLKDQGDGVGQLNIEKARMEQKNRLLWEEVQKLQLKVLELEKVQSPPDTSFPGSTAQSSPIIIRIEAASQTDTVEKSLEEEGVQARERGQVQIKEEVVEESEKMNVRS